MYPCGYVSMWQFFHLTRSFTVSDFYDKEAMVIGPIIFYNVSSSIYLFALFCSWLLTIDLFKWWVYNMKWYIWKYTNQPVLLNVRLLTSWFQHAINYIYVWMVENDIYYWRSFSAWLTAKIKFVWAGPKFLYQVKSFKWYQDNN